MGSKRPQQVHKDLLATDLKTRPNDEHIHEEDKHHLHERRGKLAIPEGGDNPALEDLQSRRAEKGEK
jgi:hypothetical protein